MTRKSNKKRATKSEANRHKDEAAVNPLDIPHHAIFPLIDRRLNEYAKLLKLKDVSQEFRVALVEAISLCIALIAMDPPPKRYSDIGEELSKVSLRAAAVAKELRGLCSMLDGLPLTYQRLLSDGWGTADGTSLSALPIQIARFDELAAFAAHFGRTTKDRDKGGAKMLEFSALVTGLAKAFKIATGRKAKATWNNYKGRWDGKFVGLVNAVLPLMLSLSKIYGKGMRHPTKRTALGSHIHRVTKESRPKRRVPLSR